jgi:nucleoid-associated protein YgaU
VWRPAAGDIVAFHPDRGQTGQQSAGAEEESTMGLRDKYSQAIQTAKSIGMQGQAEERDGKLYFSGVTRTQDEVNRIWNAIKTVADWQQDIVADIRALGPGPAAPSALGRTYTVKAGDTLSKIAKTELGNADAYNDIFEANRDQLDDPNKIKPGQVLKIPVGAR